MQPNRAVAERRLVNPAKTGILYYQVVPWLPAFSFIRTVMVMDIAGLIDSGAKRHHYSTFDVGRSMFDVHFFNFIPQVLSMGGWPSVIGGHSLR